MTPTTTGALTSTTTGALIPLFLFLLLITISNFPLCTHIPACPFQLKQQLPCSIHLLHLCVCMCVCVYVCVYVCMCVCVCVFVSLLFPHYPIASSST